MRGACAADDLWQSYRQKFRVFFREAIYQRSSDGLVEVQFLNGTQAIGGGVVDNPFGPQYKLAGFGDFNGDGKTDLVFRNPTSGTLGVELMNGIHTLSAQIESQTAQLTQAMASFGALAPAQAPSDPFEEQPQRPVLAASHG